MSEKTTEIVLLLCPFCGGEADWSEGDQKTKYGNEQVYCTYCYASTPPSSTKADAAAWWNTRVPHVHISYDPDHLNPAEGGNKASDDYW